MHPRNAILARVWAEAHFSTREQEKADVSAAVREYREAQQTKLENMQRLRRLREAHPQKAGTVSEQTACVPNPPRRPA